MTLSLHMTLQRDAQLYHPRPTVPRLWVPGVGMGATLRSSGYVHWARPQGRDNSAAARSGSKCLNNVNILIVIPFESLL